MPLLTLTILAIIQGITEFLPISSSGHLLLFPTLTGAEDQGLAIDVAVHVGTLVAVMLYFWRDVGTLLRGSRDLVTGQHRSMDARVTWLLAVATVPVVIVGVISAMTGFNDALRDPRFAIWVVAITTLFWGAVLWAADKLMPTRREFDGWTLRDALLMGVAQAVSIVPGTSRSGICMTAARGLGFGRVDAARLSMLMSIPATAAAGLWLFIKLIREGDAMLGMDAALGAVLAFFAALAALAGLMRMLRHWTFTPFVFYRFALGIGLLVVAFNS